MKDLQLTDEMVDYIDNLIKQRVDDLATVRVRESFAAMLESDVSSVTVGSGQIRFDMYDGSSVYKTFYQE